ncbi:MAG TPA: folylpolyglutamate synthase/dihydrofolate synthase family protein [Pirellulaceae bacterium]|nr:folylpolyglutamate synthase/dihydrofolate synthase family protein [Pirellulaceae bacterium]
MSSLVTWLTSRINYERQPVRLAASLRLDAIRELLKRLGDPHLAYPVVHVAGTKGKGSVTRMLASILHQAHYRTACYTSPHLFKLNERFAVDGLPIADDALEQLIQGMRPIVDACDEFYGEQRLTFFDICTALAFQYFAQQRVAVAVIEVGLGGRLDSTNVCHSDLSIITSISFDHTRQLGHTLAEIAKEKAGIIKRRIPVLIGCLPEEAASVVGGVAEEHQSPVVQLGRDFQIVDAQLHSSGAHFEVDFTDAAQFAGQTKVTVSIPLLGVHQVENAALAVAAARLLELKGFHQLLEAVPKALAEIEHAGRIEIVSSQPTLVLDVAHNVAAIEALLSTLQKQVPHWRVARRRWLILAISRDKDFRGMIARLVPHFQEILLTEFLENPRARSTGELRLAAEKRLASSTAPGDAPVNSPSACRIREFESPQAAWVTAYSEMGAEDLCCITGSLFLVAELAGLIKASLHDTIPGMSAE